MKHFEQRGREKDNEGTRNWEAKLDQLAEVLNKEGFLKNYDKRGTLKKKLKALKEALGTERKNIEVVKKQHPGIHPLGIKYMDEMITRGEIELKEIEDNL